MIRIYRIENPGGNERMVACPNDSMPNRWGRLRRWMARWQLAGGNLLFPPRCADCDAELADSFDGMLLCDDCRGELGPTGWVSCLRCGGPSPPDKPPLESCELCRRAPLRFDAAVSLGIYRDQLREVVLKMKHRQWDHLSVAMGELLSQRAEERIAPLELDAVLPIPMFWKRRLARGTNSADILAERVAQRLGLPLANRVVYRSRNTVWQATLRPGKRFGNVRGAFRLKAGYHLDGLRLLLVDDVLTTGATSSEVARSLKEAGASWVAVAVLARGIGASAS